MCVFVCAHVCVSLSDLDMWCYPSIHKPLSFIYSNCLQQLQKECTTGAVCGELLYSTQRRWRPYSHQVVVVYIIHTAHTFLRNNYVVSPTVYVCIYPNSYTNDCSVSPFPAILHQHAALSKWEAATKLCRFVKVSSPIWSLTLNTTSPSFVCTFRV